MLLSNELDMWYCVLVSSHMLFANRSTYDRVPVSDRSQVNTQFATWYCVFLSSYLPLAKKGSTRVIIWSQVFLFLILERPWLTCFTLLRLSLAEICALVVFLVLFSSTCTCRWPERSTLWQWRHNEPDGVSNHQPHNCLPNRLFRHRSKKTSKRHWPLCGEFTGDRWIPRTKGQ